MTDDAWFRAFVHECGHATIATMHAIRCHGIFLLQKPKIKACTLVDPLPPPSELFPEQRLYLAAGSAAERLVLGEADPQGAGEDKRLFGQPVGETFEGKVEEARTLLTAKKALIESLAMKLYKMYQNAGGDFKILREQQAGVGLNITLYWVLLAEKELRDELKDVAPRNNKPT
jgi:hypothetical protein